MIRQVINMEFQDDNNSKVDIKTMVEVEFKITNNVVTKMINITKDIDDSNKMTYHRINITSSKSAILLQLNTTFTHEIISIFFRKWWTPTVFTYDYKTFSKSNGQGVIHVVIPENKVKMAGIYFIGIMVGNFSLQGINIFTFTFVNFADHNFSKIFRKWNNN